MKITTICKYVDQPIILNKLDKKMPVLLIGTGGAFGVVNSVKSAQKDKKTAKQKFAQNVIIISSTIGASLLGTRGLKINGKKTNKFFNQCFNLISFKKFINFFINTPHFQYYFISYYCLTFYVQTIYQF